MNSSSITWSNQDSKDKYYNNFHGTPKLRYQYELGKQCGGCKYFIKINEDFGSCSNKNSDHNNEIISEHFTCSKIDYTGWESNEDM